MLAKPETTGLFSLECCTVTPDGLANTSPIIAVDISESRLKLAGTMGATHLVNSLQSDPFDQVMAITKRRGVEHAFEVVGNTALMNLGLELLARGGLLTLIGAAGRDDVLAMKPRRFMSMQQRIAGCIDGNIRPELDLPMFADWVMQGKLRLDELLGKIVRLDEVPGIFASPQDGSGVRTMIQFEA